MQEPVSFMIDELTYLVGTAAQNDELLTADIDELVNRITRSHGVWLTLTTQELFQLPEQIRQTVVSMGTVIFGQTADSKAAQELAERYFRYDPHLVKKEETRWRTVYDPNRRRGQPPEAAPVERTVEYTRDEQTYLKSRIFLDLAPFHFLIGQSRREGELPTSLRPFTIERVDAGEYPNRTTTDSLRTQLMRRDGIKTATILTEIGNRLTDSPQPPPQPATAESRGPRPAPDEAASSASGAAPAQSDWAPAGQPVAETPSPDAPPPAQAAGTGDEPPPLRPIRPRTQPRKPSQPGRKKPPDQA